MSSIGFLATRGQHETLKTNWGMIICIALEFVFIVFLPVLFGRCVGLKYRLPLK